jgi:hypothetical protein
MYPIEGDVFKQIPWVAAKDKIPKKLETTTITKDDSEMSKFHLSVISLAKRVTSISNCKFKTNVNANGRNESFSISHISKFVWDDSSISSSESARTESTNSLSNHNHLQATEYTLDHVFPMPSVPHVLEEEEDRMSISLNTEVSQV